MVRSARQINGTELPPAGTWKIDPAHTTAAFVGRHMLSKTRGIFAEVDGTFTIAENPEESRVEVEIKAASVESKVEQRDQHLKSADFMDVEKYPLITFTSTSVRPGQGNEFQLVGDLTIKDVTREVVLEAEYHGYQADPYGNTVLAASAKTTIEREDFGMTWNVMIEAGSVLVGKKVEIELEVEAVLQQDA